MAIKESSDELNPPIAVASTAVPAKRPVRSAKDYLAIAVATCGVGYLPLAPGTWGSLLAIVIYVLIRGILMTTLFNLALELRLNTFHLFYSITAFQIVIAVLISLAGTWAGSRFEKLSGKKDPSQVVIDEVAGQYIALAAVPFMFEPGWWAMILAFVLFRVFDIVKPYPARKMESLPGGLGIMGDDIVAGFYAAATVMLVVTIRWFI